MISLIINRRLCKDLLWKDLSYNKMSDLWHSPRGGQHIFHSFLQIFISDLSISRSLFPFPLDDTSQPSHTSTPHEQRNRCTQQNQTKEQAAKGCDDTPYPTLWYSSWFSQEALQVQLQPPSLSVGSFQVLKKGQGDNNPGDPASKGHFICIIIKKHRCWTD
jgi:hypothetical protein